MSESDRFIFELKERGRTLVTDLSVSSSVLVIAFSGKAGNLGIPAFEFFNIMRPFRVRKIFFRDLKHSWYHTRLPEICSSFDDAGVESTRLYLRRLIDSLDVKRVVVIGNSAGAYAAILFGYLLAVEEVHAFSPKTFINPFKRLRYGEIGNWRKVLSLYSIKDRQKEYFDLKKVLLNHSSQTCFQIYYSFHNYVDRVHAEHLGMIPNVTLRKYDYDRHGLVKHLKKTGELKDIVAGFCAG